MIYFKKTYDEQAIETSVPICTQPYQNKLSLYQTAIFNNNGISKTTKFILCDDIISHNVGFDLMKSN